MTLMQERARRGAAWLDQQVPGWHNRINLWKLDIEYGDNCIIGQLYGDYDDWMDEVGRSNDFAIRHGLFVRHRKGKNWDKQTDAWIEEIHARQRLEIRGRVLNEILL